MDAGDSSVSAGNAFLEFVKSVFPALYRAVGAPSVLAVEVETPGVSGTLRLVYDLPVDFCHSYDPSSPINSSNNAPTAQGGLLGGILDNAMTLAVQEVSGGRFITTLNMSTNFVRPTRPGPVFAEAKVLRASGTVAYATVSVFSDRTFRNLTAFATSTSKLAKPRTSVSPVPTSSVVQPHGDQRVSDIELWHIPLTRSVRVLWTLLEIQRVVPGLKFHISRVQLASESEADETSTLPLYSPRALAMNRNHTVPLLRCSVDGDEVVVFESGAIVNFLADAFPAACLAPGAHDLAGRARFHKWLHYACTMVDSILWQVRLHHNVMGLLPSAERDPRIVAAYSEKFAEEVEKQVADQLQDGRPYILGETFSAADICLGYDFLWAKMFGIRATEPRVVSYVRRLRCRPTFTAALADAHLFPSPEQHQAMAEQYRITRRSGKSGSQPTVGSSRL